MMLIDLNKIRIKHLTDKGKDIYLFLKIILLYLLCLWMTIWTSDARCKFMNIWLTIWENFWMHYNSWSKECNINKNESGPK